MKNGCSYYSGDVGHCVVPGCTETPLFGDVTVSVANTTGAPEPNLLLYAYEGATCFGRWITDSDDQVTATLPSARCL